MALLELDRMSKEEVVAALHLSPHPEGGFFRETWRSDVLAVAHGTSESNQTQQVCGTAIYFLLGTRDRSHLHILHGNNDEAWHHYGGASIEIVEIVPENGELRIVRLGKKLGDGEVLQHVVKAGHVFGSRVVLEVKPGEGNGECDWALVGCTVCPGFEFSQFEIPSRKVLLEKYPQHERVILDLTRPDDAGSEAT
eukprot:g7913.t1